MKASIYRGLLKQWYGDHVDVTSSSSSANRITPGNGHGNRVAGSNDPHLFFIANGSSVLSVKANIPEENQEEENKEEGLHNKIKLYSKTGLPAQQAFSSLHESLLFSSPSPSFGEIQNISFNFHKGQQRIASIDEYGVTNISILDHSDDPSSLVSVKSQILLPAANGKVKCREEGWAGLCFGDEENEDLLVSGHLFDKCLSLFDLQAPGGPKILRTQKCANMLTSIHMQNIPQSSSSSPLLFTTEYNQLAIYDLRVAGYASCIKRLTPSTSWLYGIGVGEGVVAVGGDSRTLSIYEARRSWSLKASWSNCLKHEIRGVYFSKVSKELCFVAGVDAEVIVGEWEKGGGTANHFSCLRVDSRWIGLCPSSLPKEDTIYGTTAQGTVYLVQNASKMYNTPDPSDPASSTSALKGHRGVSKVDDE
eukprot:TRINITY_DN4819_c0_g2_i2.p1 TRINITY_DN4819_c0_g2~~TRINITY_DN4819_c0_g2_i2.p1  ORF type:complete len:421 (-),score=138.94 TRINITY_DN4819_c0_g2_i2:11-1273(-)